MARGRKRRKRRSKFRPRAHVIEEYRDPAREQEFLNSQVRKDGKGEDPIIRALIYDLPSASQEEATEIALELQRRMRGDASLLENPDDMSDIIEGIRAEAAEVDKAGADWEANRHAFVEDVINRAPKVTEEQREKIRARVGQEYSQAVTGLRAQKYVKQMEFKRLLESAPTESIHVTGTFRIKNKRQVHEPDIVSIMGLHYVLEPGVRTVPQPIAEAYRAMQKARSLERAQKAILSGQGAPQGSYDQSTLEVKMAEAELEHA